MLACLPAGAAPGFASDSPLAALGLADESPDAASAAPRIVRPPSKIAENITVVTADDIARLNAHTLADVLQTIPGIQLDYQRTPGTFTFFNIQGALNNTVLVLVDGVRQNDFAQNTAEPGLITVQQIERIEIVKGAASAAWGPALGGVVNIVTKSPDWERTAGGLVSGSAGKRATTDGRVEASGASGPFGYYLTGGNLRSDGLQPNNRVDMTHVMGKAVWRDAAGGTLTAGVAALNNHQGMDEGSAYGWPVHDDGSREQRSGYLKYSRPLAPRLTLDLDASALSRVLETDFNDRFDGENIPFQYTRGTESTRNAGARLTWGDSRRNLVAGAEYGHVNAKSEQVAPTAFVWNMRRWDQGAVYANGTLSIGRVTILPGIRYDHTGLSRQYTSYTLGATWQATENTLLRGYAARGFGLPFPDMLASGLMKVHTLQAGFESAGIPYVWLKGTYFFNRLRDIESVGAATLTNQSRKGFELEARTTPLYGVSLTGGYTFTYVKDTDTGERLKTNSDQAVPPHVLKLGLLYDALDLGLRGALTGSYVAWNPAEDYPAVSHGTVWDLHLAWKVKPQAERSPELFCSGRNLFSNVQTTFNDLFANTSRWFEGGVRWNF